MLRVDSEKISKRNMTIWEKHKLENGVVGYRDTVTRRESKMEESEENPKP